MYKALTKLIDAMETDTYGEIIIDTGGKGTADEPFRFPYARYTDVVKDLLDAVYGFAELHPEYDLYNYRDILVRNGLEWNSESMSEADVSSADGQLVMALLTGAARAERFAEGTLLEFCKDGLIIRWLKRLKEIDDQ